VGYIARSVAVLHEAALSAAGRPLQAVPGSPYAMGSPHLIRPSARLADPALRGGARCPERVLVRAAARAAPGAAMAAASTRTAGCARGGARPRGGARAP